MILTTWYFPVNFTPENYTSKLNFEKKKFSIPERGPRSVLKSENDYFGISDGIFFFLEKKVDHNVFWGGIHWRLPWCCNHFDIISGSQSKFDKSEFFIVFSTFDRDPEIII